VNEILHFPDSKRSHIQPFIGLTFGSNQGAASVVCESPLTVPVPTFFVWSHLAVYKFASVEILEVNVVVSSFN